MGRELGEGEGSWGMLGGRESWPCHLIFTNYILFIYCIEDKFFSPRCLSILNLTNNYFVCMSSLVYLQTFINYFDSDFSCCFLRNRWIWSPKNKSLKNQNLIISFTLFLDHLGNKNFVCKNYSWEEVYWLLLDYWTIKFVITIMLTDL